MDRKRMHNLQISGREKRIKVEKHRKIKEILETKVMEEYQTHQSSCLSPEYITLTSALTHLTL